MKKAIQFGAGNIGRGFIGYLMSRSSYEVLFCDVNESVIGQINSKGSYKLIIKDICKREETINNIRAMSSLDENLTHEISTCDLITTAVGVSILSRVGETISKGIKLRIRENNTSPLNIIACENAVNATDILREEIFKHLDENEKNIVNNFIGFPNCSVDRIVPKGDNDSIDVCAEEFFEWNVERNKIVGDLNIEGMNLVDNLEAYIERKLFTLNTGHAMTAYLGFNRGYETIFDSINDEFIYENVYEAMKESGEGLVLKYSLDYDNHMKYIDKIINRFKNPYLRDEVLRVGREPMRKLSKDDRFIKPILTSYSYNKKIDKLCLGVSYALLFLSNEDENSIKMREMIDKNGVSYVLEEVSGLKDKYIIDKILSYYNEIKA